MLSDGLAHSREREELRSRTAGLGESDVARAKASQKIRRTPGHEKRFRSLRQKPQDFVETLERTKHLVDIIRHPTPIGAGSEERLEHRLEHLIGESIVDEQAIITKTVKVVRLGNKVFANIAKADGKHWYCVDFPARPHACELKIEIWSNTDSNGVRFYVDRHDTPTPASFDWWSPGNASITIGPDDKRFQFGRYWITVVAMGTDARYMLHCAYNIHRPPVRTVHDKVAEKLLKTGVKEHVLASNERYEVSRNSTKCLGTAFREQFKDARQGRKVDDLAGPTRSQGAHMQEAALLPLRSFASKMSTSRKRPASATPETGNGLQRDVVIDEKVHHRCDVFEKKFMKSTLEPCSMFSRSVSVKDSPFNPAKLRESLALIHEVTSATSNNKEKVENGVVDARDICAEFMARSMRLTIEATTRSAAHRLGGRLVSAMGGGPISLAAGRDSQKTRTRAQWAVTTEDPRLRKMIGREGLPRRMHILRNDAVDYRTHSFDTGNFRLSRVGALEMSAANAYDAEGNTEDVDYKHLAQIQELVSATDITLLDQPSCFFCFRLEFPPESPRGAAKVAQGPNAGSKKHLGGQPHLITLAAASAEQRTQWLEALNLFCELTAAERARAAKRAAAKKQRLAASRSDKMANALALPAATQNSAEDCGEDSAQAQETSQGFGVHGPVERLIGDEIGARNQADEVGVLKQSTARSDAFSMSSPRATVGQLQPRSAIPSYGRQASATIAAIRPTPARPARPATALR